MCCESREGVFHAKSLLLTIPGVLGLSAGLWVKLPLWLVDTVCDFLLLRPMASIDWLLLRMTRYRERRGHIGASVARGRRTRKTVLGSAAPTRGRGIICWNASQQLAGKGLLNTFEGAVKKKNTHTQVADLHLVASVRGWNGATGRSAIGQISK